jgi:putative FmdB family regulatory protein
MPIYSYRCRDCGEVFDLLEGVSAEKVRRRCPKCSGGALQKIHAAFNVGPGGSRRPPEAACPTCPSGPAGCGGGACPF